MAKGPFGYNLSLLKLKTKNTVACIKSVMGHVNSA